MKYTEIDLQRNSIVKKLGLLLSQIDYRIKWTDYIPGSTIKTGSPLVVIGMNSGIIKYLNVSNLNSSKLASEVLKAIDDYCLDVQFLTPKQLLPIMKDITTLANDRAKITDEILHILEESNLSSNDCIRIIRKAQNAEIFPDFFPQIENPTGITTEMLCKFLKTSEVTFMDTHILANLILEQIKELTNIHKNDVDNEEDYDR